MTRPPRSIGIDLGASAVHVVALTGATHSLPNMTDAHVFDSSDLRGVVEIAADADQIAIDAPDRLSTAPHDDDELLKPKFRHARCAEIALGQSDGIWVPWTTPADPSAVPGWMQVGFALWVTLREAGHEPLEVYPAGMFRVLAGSVPPRKTTRAGMLARVGLLAPHLDLPVGIEVWSHDGIDALGAALTARWRAEGRARAVMHNEDGCDASEIWLPDLDSARSGRLERPTF